LTLAEWRSQIHFNQTGTFLSEIVRLFGVTTATGQGGILKSIGSSFKERI
jgi:hypothetical protein